MISQMVSLNQILLCLSVVTLKKQQNHDKIAERSKFLNEYDFIVVGGGVAGSVIASRISEVCKFSVLLLEAGGTQPVISELPQTIPIDDVWKLETTRQKKAFLGYKDQKLQMSKGKVLGGGSVVNSRTYMRGCRQDYDNWRDEFGLEDWAYDKIKKYFIKSENNTDFNLVKANYGYHGVGGPWTISSANTNPLLGKLHEFLNAFGFPTVDLNGASCYGVAFAQKAIKDNVRQSMSTAFLEPNTDRENLHVMVHALVTRLKIENNKVVAVEFYKNNSFHQVKVRREVIVSTGVFKSPQLLMLSGIGLKQHLEEHKIKPIIDLPVGNNFHDQINLKVYFDIVGQKCIGNLPTFTIENLYDFFVNHRGVFAERGQIHANFNTKYNQNLNWPDVTLYTTIEVMNQTKISSAFEDEAAWSDYLQPYDGRWVLRVIVRINRPKSRGTIRLRSASPFDSPLIDPNHFENSTDFDILLEGTKLISRLLKSLLGSSIRSLGPVPGCRDHSCASNDIYLCEEYLKCFISKYTREGLHFVGSCRMGTTNDPNSVVDQQLKVKGLANLRVIDASVMPLVITGNTMAPTVMIAEKGAEIIIKSHAKDL